jgi:hypothetical protein
MNKEPCKELDLRRELGALNSCGVGQHNICVVDCLISIPRREWQVLISENAIVRLIDQRDLSKTRVQHMEHFLSHA